MLSFRELGGFARVYFSSFFSLPANEMEKE